MAYLLDTNIVIHIRDGTPSVVDSFQQSGGNVSMSSLTFAELQRGIFKLDSQSTLRQARLTTMLKQISVIPFDAEAALAYGRIIAACGWVRGRDFDRMIGAHALATQSILVTNNVADFSDIPGLLLENWV